MRIVIRYFASCPNWEITLSRLNEAIEELGILAEIRLEVVESAEEAARVGFRGSPSVLVDGHDPFADQAGPVGLSCRIYRTDVGPQGSPSVRQLVGALRR